METLLGKLSIFDFFNLVFSGIVFLLGFELFGIQIISYYFSICISRFSSDLSAASICFYLGMISLCYIVGSVIQEIGDIIKKRIIYKKDDPMKTFLKNEEVLENIERKKKCVNMAKKYFKKNKIVYNEGDFTDDQDLMFYTHCEYFIQAKGLNDKIEKMRGLRGVSTVLATTFTVLPILSCVILLIDKYIFDFKYIEMISIFQFVFGVIISGVLAVIFWHRMKKNIKFKIRMIIGLYEVLSEQ